MGKQFSLVKGIQIPCLDGIEEGYHIEKLEGYYQININVSSKNIDKVFRSLCLKVRQPGFLVLEHSSRDDVEKELRKSDTDPIHKDVYYLNELDLASFFKIYDQYKELLINDGVIHFGFSSYSGVDQVFVGMYKIFFVLTDKPDKYVKILDGLGMLQKENLKTVWENISDTSPAVRMLIKHNGMDIYDMVELLSKQGLFLAERQEEV